MTVYYIGMDVHSRKTTICVGTDSGKVILETEVETSREGMEGLIERIRVRYPDEKIELVAGMESGNISFGVAKLLKKLGVEVDVIHAREVRDKTSDKRKKTDRRDAEELYEGLWRHYYRKEVYIPTDTELELRWLFSKRESAVKVSTMQVLGAKDSLRRWRFREFAERKLATPKSWEKLMNDVGGMDKEQWKRIVGWDMKDRFYQDLLDSIEEHYGMWKQARETVERYEEKIIDVAAGLSREIREGIVEVTLIFGIGLMSSIAMAVLIGDPGRFRKSGQVKSYFGLTPSEYSSGDRTRQGGLTKTGNGFGRKILVELAQQATRPNHPLHPLYKRMYAKKGHNSAKVVVAGKLVGIIWRMLRDGGSFDLSRLGVSMVKVNGLNRLGRKVTKLEAVRTDRLPEFLTKHNMTLDAVVDLPESLEDKEKRRFLMKKMGLERPEAEVEEA